MASGLRNRDTIELARHHCLNMTFTQCGGRGLVEAQTGLPVNMRQVGCLVAHGNASSGLESIATDFYRDHCIGCEYRRPTGEVPNLATLVEERDAEAARAAEERQAQTRAQREAWAQRTEHRRGLVASSDPAMVGALDDIAVLDGEPGRDRDETMYGAALERLNALAQRSPEMFSGEVVDVALSLAGTCDVTAVLTPLRHLARRRAEFAPAGARCGADRTETAPRGGCGALPGRHARSGAC